MFKQLKVKVDKKIPRMKIYSFEVIEVYDQKGGKRPNKMFYFMVTNQIRKNGHFMKQ